MKIRWYDMFSEEELRTEKRKRKAEDKPLEVVFAGFNHKLKFEKGRIGTDVDQLIDRGAWRRFDADLWTN